MTSVMLSFRCPKELASRLVQLARSQDVKASDVIRAALTIYLEREDT